MPGLYSSGVYPEGVPTLYTFVSPCDHFLVYGIPKILLYFLKRNEMLPTTFRVSTALGLFKFIRLYYWQNQLETHII
jgi:hypothetical protein